MKRSYLSLSLLGSLGGASFAEIPLNNKDSMTQNLRPQIAAVPHRLKKYWDTSSADNHDFNLQDNALSNMLTERLQELVAGNIYSREQVIAPSENAIGALDQEVHHETLEGQAPSSSHVHSFVPNLTKVLARTGCCSRSEAKVLISRGDVSFNGQVVTDSSFVCSPRDNINVVGVQGRLRFSPPRLWMYHKPRNVSASVYDPQGRKVMMSHAAILGFDHIIPVGCLSFPQHGLMLLTNDGSLASYLEHPSTNLSHVYRFRVAPAISPILAHRLNERGVDIDGIINTNYEFTVDPRRSKNYVKIKVRGEDVPMLDVLKSLGRSIKRGGRVALGPFQINGLGLGTTREVAIPPSYFHHIGDHWKPFVERDWPFFRRKRILALKTMGKYRVLSQKEMEELDTFTSEELRESTTSKQNVLPVEALPDRPQVNMRLK